MKRHEADIILFRRPIELLTSPTGRLASLARLQRMDRKAGRSLHVLHGEELLDWVAFELRSKTRLDQP